MIKIGTCGFSFRDWKGTVYPASIKNEDILPYYHKNAGMDTVEIDASYYAIPSRKAVESWLRKTPDDFLFSAKCHKEMTLNEKAAGEVNQANDELFTAFLDSWTPLIESGRVVAFLAQFGPLFWKSSANCDYLLRFREKMKEHPLVVEFRHSSWLSPEEREDTFEFLSRNNLLYAAVDLPGIRTLPPFIPHRTGEIAYFRFHGRNKDWFTAGREKRYDYNYSDEELKEFIPHIKAFEGQAKFTLVYFNNCHAGAALRNAMKLKRFLMPEAARIKPVKTYVQGELNLGI